ENLTIQSISMFLKWLQNEVFFPEKKQGLQTLAARSFDVSRIILPAKKHCGNSYRIIRVYKQEQYQAISVEATRDWSVLDGLFFGSTSAMSTTSSHRDNGG